MDTYADILLIAIPFFLVLILIEWYVGIKRNHNIYSLYDTISSLSSGITNSIKDILGLSIIILSYEWFYSHLSINNSPASWWMYIIAFIVLDFAGYWVHRWEHMINVLWNRHIIHHSSEEFNLACALRQNVSAIFAWFTFLLIPAAIIGVHPTVIAVVAPIHLFAQFWYHTKLIDKMGMLEYVIVTPSHHRVHHAINDKYIDKNFGQIFIVWDKLFGTFQEEDKSDPPVYGIKKPALTWNPILINFQHLWGLSKDAWSTRRYMEKLLLWVKPTGYRPADMAEAHPYQYISNPHQYTKYQSAHSKDLKWWSFIQFSFGLLLFLYFCASIGDYPFFNLLFFGIYLFAYIFSTTSLMDGDRIYLIGELVKLAVIPYSAHTWLGVPTISIMFITLLIIGVNYYYYRKYFQQNKTIRETM